MATVSFASQENEVFLVVGTGKDMIVNPRSFTGTLLSVFTRYILEESSSKDIAMEPARNSGLQWHVSGSRPLKEDYPS